MSMGHPIMSTKQILFFMVVMVIALVAYQYLGGKQILKFPRVFNLQSQEEQTPIEGNFVKQPASDEEAAVVGEMSIVETKANLATLKFDAKGKLGEVVEMVVWTDTNAVSDWEKYEETAAVEIDIDTKIAYVKFRDAKNYESIAYSVSVK